MNGGNLGLGTALSEFNRDFEFLIAPELPYVYFPDKEQKLFMDKLKETLPDDLICDYD